MWHRLSHGRFLPNDFQFINQLSSYHQFLCLFRCFISDTFAVRLVGLELVFCLLKAGGNVDADAGVRWASSLCVTHLIVKIMWRTHPLLSMDFVNDDHFWATTRWTRSGCNEYACTNTVTQNYWIFGLCPSSGIVETIKHNVSETGSVSVLRWEGGTTPTQLGPLERANLRG
jgi:hypothetical protein